MEALFDFANTSTLRNQINCKCGRVISKISLLKYRKYIPTHLKADFINII